MDEKPSTRAEQRGVGSTIIPRPASLDAVRVWPKNLGMNLARVGIVSASRVPVFTGNKSSQSKFFARRTNNRTGPHVHTASTCSEGLPPPQLPRSRAFPHCHRIAHTQRHARLQALIDAMNTPEKIQERRRAAIEHQLAHDAFWADHHTLTLLASPASTETPAGSSGGRRA